MSPKPIMLKNGETISPGKIVCVGRNYVEHARELGNEAPSEPVLFLKPSTSLVEHDSRVCLPWHVGRIDHEIELAVVISRTSRNVEEDVAMDHILGYSVILDITARTLQENAKKKGLPWTVCKGYDGFAPMSDIARAEDVSNPQCLDIVLEVNGETRQRGNTRDMIFPVEKLISHISGIMTLEKGDIIATGTPAGVSPLHKGDKILGKIQDVGELHIEFE